jgi:hypothetical protein
MPRNSSGVFSLTVAAFAPGGLIKSSDDNSLFSDIATALTQSLATTGVSTMTGPIKAASGSVAAPSITFGSETNSGIYRKSAGIMGFVIGGNEIAEVSATGIDVDSGLALTVGGTTPPIPNSFVTYAKIQNVAASRLLGNPTGGAAAPSEISLGGGMSFSGTSLVSTANPALFPGYISGLTLSTAGGSGTFGIAAGAANDTNSGGIMVLSAAYTKTTASWAVGSGNGALDTGSIANNTWYHVYLIERTDTGVVDVLFSLQPAAVGPTNPTLPASYTLSRRIGAMLTDSSAHWIKFTQVVDQFIWSIATLDANGTATSSGARTTFAVTVPTGVSVIALFRARMRSSSNNPVLLFTSGFESDQAASETFIGDLQDGTAAAGAIGDYARITNTSGQLFWRATNTGAVFYVSTYGWIDTRGK